MDSLNLHLKQIFEMKILYESSVLSNNYDKKNNGRSGIFHCASNILVALDNNLNVKQIELFSKQVDSYVRLLEYLKLIKFKKTSVLRTNLFQHTLSLMQIYENQCRKKKKNIQRVLANILKHSIMFFNFKRKIKKFDIAFFPMSLVGFQGIDSDKKFIILYDMMPVLFPQNYPTLKWHHDLLEFMSENIGNDSIHYFAISEHTKKDFLKHIPNLPADSITVMPLAANSKFYHEKNAEKINSVKSKYGIPNDRKYILSLCSLEPRKNIIMACKAFCAFIKKHNIKDLVFVLAGGHWDSFLPVLNKELEGMGDAAKNIMQAGYVDDQDMSALYSGAEWFVYTSQYEGFGLPPLEAMQCGTPVITSNNSSLPEVVGDAGIMIDYDSLEQHVKAFEDYYFNSDLKKQNAVKGIERAKTFNWKKSAEIIMEQFKKNIKDWKK